MKKAKIWWWWCRALEHWNRFAISHLSIFYLDTGHSMKLYWAESTHTLVYHTSWRTSKWSMVLFNTDPRNPLAGGSSSIPLPSTSFCSNHWLLAWADHKTTTKVVPQNIAKLTTTWPRCWLATHQSFWQLAHTLHIDHQTATLTLLQLGNNTIGIILKDSQTPDCRCILLSE